MDAEYYREMQEYLDFMRQKRASLISQEQWQAQQVIDVLEDWFWAIETGNARDRVPDLRGKIYSAKEVNELIDLIDRFFEAELSNAQYWAEVGKKSRGTPIDMSCEFRRLEGGARLAFAQDVYRKIEEIYGVRSH